MPAAELVVRGESEVRVVPDFASVRVDIDGEGSSQDDAYAAATKLAEQVDAVLGGRTAALGRVVTAAFVVQPKSRWRKGETVRTGWRATRSTVVEITALEEVGVLLSHLVRAGAAVDGPWWQLAPANVAHDAVRTAAAIDARRRADAYAQGLGLVVGDVAWVAEPGLRMPSEHHGGWAGELMSARAAGGGAHANEDEPIAVSPGEITLTAAVEIGFEFRAQAAPRSTDAS